jgi:ribonuclease J
MVRPRIAVPVHGEARHLIGHAELARSWGAAETVVAANGAMVRLAPGPAEIVDNVPVGRLVLDGRQLRPFGSTALKSRQRMVFNGTAVATIVLDGKGKLLAAPVLTVHGLIEDEDAAEIEQLGDAIGRALGELSPAQRRDDAVVREAARLAVRRRLKADYGKAAVTDIHLVRV